MITKEDLKVVDVGSYRPGNERHVVCYGDRYFIVGATNIDVDNEEMIDLLAETDPMELMVLALGIGKPQDSYVMEAKLDEDLNYVPMYECSEECATGVCKKRIASDFDTGSMDRAYAMLLAYLNA